MNQREIKISVIMACHNSSAYLDESINSVLTQTFGDWELILIDDCSTDNTFEIAKRYQAQDFRISILSLTVNSGPAIARNAGIRTARGDWLAILDSDDIAMPTRFEEQLKLANSAKDLVMIGSNSISIDDKGNIITEHKYPTSHQHLVKKLSTKSAFPPHSSMLYKRSIVQELLGFNPKYLQSEDCDLWLRLSEVGKLASIDKPLVKIRKHVQNISNSEGGIQQIRFGYVALICHFLRTHRYADPSTNNDEILWQSFIQWVDRRMKEEFVFEKYKVWIDARTKFFSTKNKFVGMAYFINHIFRSGYAVEVIKEKFFGSSLPKYLALEWATINQSNSKISVIMACHNSSPYLDESIRSVLKQSYSNLELILIDDCSTDNTLEIAKRYQAQDPRVSVLSLSVNSGPAITRNTGIQVAKGEWLAILDSDDIAMPTRFEEQLKLANSEKDLVMIGSSSVSIDDKSNVITKHKYPTSHQDLVKRLSTKSASPPHSSMLYKRDIVQKLSGFNPKFVRSQDYDLWFRLSRVGKIASIDKPLAKIRKHAQNISNSEGGMLQARFGCAALICHFLRSCHYPDPSSCNDEIAWQGFIKWVDHRMIECGEFERRKAWANARATFFSTKNRLTGSFRFTCCLLQSGHAIALIWEKFFGSSLPKRLAKEWMNRVSTS